MSVTSVAGKTGVVTLVPADAGVVVGTTSGTFAAGNDPRITGSAQKSQNLSDLVDKAAARETLKIPEPVTLAELGSSALAGLPTGRRLNIIGRATAYDNEESIQAVIVNALDQASQGWYGARDSYAVPMAGGRFAVQPRAPRSIIRLPDPEYWGDGTRDASALINGLLYDAEGTVLVLPPPPVAYYCASKIIVPTGRSLIAEHPQPFEIYGGTRLIFPLDMQGACVEVHGSEINGSRPSVIKGISITRRLTRIVQDSATSNSTVQFIRETRAEIPDGSIGLSLGGQVGCIVEDVTSMGHDHCIALPKTITEPFNGATVLNGGLGYFYNRVQTGVAKSSHITLWAGAEHRFNQCRFGMNGQQDISAKQYVLIGRPSNATNVNEGADSLFFVNCQFNEGNGTGRDLDYGTDLEGIAGVGRVLMFDDYKDSDGLINFTACHFEQYKVFAESVNASPTALYRVRIEAATGIQNATGAVMNARQQLVNIPGDRIREFEISNSTLVGSWTFDGAEALTIAGGTFIGTSVSFNAIKSGSVSGAYFVAGVSLSGAMEAFSYVGNRHASNGTGANSLSLTATGELAYTANVFRPGYSHPDIEVLPSNYVRHGDQLAFTSSAMNITTPTSHSGGVFTIPHGGVLSPDYSSEVTLSVRDNGGARFIYGNVVLDGASLYLEVGSTARADELRNRRAMLSWKQFREPFATI